MIYSKNCFTVIWTMTIALFVCNIFAVSSDARHRHATLAREFTSRLQELSHWRCTVPKQKLVYIEDEHKSRITPNAVWIPSAAVVHRCDQSTGCCSNHPSFTCKPTSSEPVSLVFQHINMLTSEMTYQRLEFSNHTACACQSITPPPTNDV